MAYTKNDIIKDTRPIFEELMWDNRHKLGRLLHQYENDNPDITAKIVFKIEFSDEVQVTVF